MSGIGGNIFGRVYNASANKIRSYEGLFGNVIANTKIVRRFVFYGGSVYCAGELFRLFVIENGSSEGPSMYPTMRERTPFTLTSKLHAHGKDMQPGDIVNFTSPIFSRQIAGKRIIGMPGDFIVNDANQSPSVGGAPVPGITDWQSSRELASKSSHGQEGDEKRRDREEPLMIEIPEGHVYVVGDNLSYSRDSRFYGPVPMALINGKQIMHAESLGLWHWTTGNQMRRIPKEDEAAYLRDLQAGRRQQEQQQKIIKDVKTS